MAHSHRLSSASHSSSLADSYYHDDCLSHYADHLPSDSVSTASNHNHPHASSQQLHHHHPSPPPPPPPPPPPAKNAKKKASLAAINVPSFSTFRSNLPSAVRQPPYAAFHGQSSPRAVSFSLTEKSSPRLADPTSRPLSLGSPRPQQSQQFHLHRQHSGLAPTQLDEEREDPHDRTSYSIHATSHGRDDSIDSRIPSSVPSSAYSSSPQHPDQSVHAKHAHRPPATHAPHHPTSPIDPVGQYPESRSSMLAFQKAPALHMDAIGPVQRVGTDESMGEATAKATKPTAGGLGSFFGWKTPQKLEGESSPTTTFSERSLSPVPSPRHIKTLPMEDGRRASARLTPPTLDIQKANGGIGYFENPQTPLLLGANNAHVMELERELSHISQELAGSIRREMELEDELDRIRAELPMLPPSDLSLRRSSDYFSDSGASSTKFPITDVDAKLEQLEKQVRKVEQEKANLKVEAASRLQTELSRRRDLEELVQTLEDQLDRGKAEQGQRGKLEELESILDETRRRLGQEKMTKESVEDLYSATREELEKLRNEADNLRNEVVPQLRARVEGLETEAADNQTLMYENTRLQQELAALRDDNHSRFNSIAEEGVASAINPARISLTRGGSLARSSSLRRGGSVNQKEGGRPRAGSTSVGYPDGVREIEDQRDALHKALKLLIKRYERQQKEHERAVKKLSVARDRAEQISPKRTAYSKEVSFLKEEVTTLRKRTEDALEQKWQYEKNLSGLKMDLDRAEQETRGLRIMLQEKDIDAPSERSHSISGYSGTENEEDEELKLSISRAENERDHARQVATEYRQKAQAASDSSSASELMNSAKRMEELAEQLERQVQANTQLRDRLSTAVAKGEREQKDSTRQIEEMQRRLAGMEDSVLAAQQHSETTLANHDAEVRRIEDASSPQLQRLVVSIPEPHKLKLGPASPLLKKSPKLGSKKLSETSLLEASRTQMLERKVRELEGLLREAEEDMQVVVQRVNKSQMEVADLQTERDAALVQMRKLQNLIIEEREKAEALFVPR